MENLQQFSQKAKKTEFFCEIFELFPLNVKPKVTKSFLQRPPSAQGPSKLHLAAARAVDRRTMPIDAFVPRPPIPSFAVSLFAAIRGPALSAPYLLWLAQLCGLKQHEQATFMDKKPPPAQVVHWHMNAFSLIALWRAP